MIVACAGIPRSGSTWLFNATRIIVENSGLRVNAGWIDDFIFDDDFDFNIVKLHDPDHAIKSKANVVMTSKRDLRDIAASLQTMNWAGDKERMIEQTIKFRKMHEFWLETAALDIKYENLICDYSCHIFKIAECLRIGIDTDMVHQLSAKIPTKPATVNSYGHDPISLLHENHINDGRSGRWKQQIDADTANEIWNANHQWMADNEYCR